MQTRRTIEVTIDVDGADATVHLPAQMTVAELERALLTGWNSPIRVQISSTSGCVTAALAQEPMTRAGAAERILHDALPIDSMARHQIEAAERALHEALDANESPELAGLRGAIAALSAPAREPQEADYA